MINSWTRLVEDTRTKTFVYSCPEGHAWSRNPETWVADNFDADGHRIPNNCPTCETTSGPTAETN